MTAVALLSLCRAMAQTTSNGVAPATNSTGGPVGDSGMNRTGGGTAAAGAGYLTGNVVRDDGSPDLLNIAIERVCSTLPVTVAHTDARGYFSFRVGGTNTVALDASQSGAHNSSGVLGSLSAVMGPVRNSVGPGPGAATAVAPGAFQNCELRASLAGYHSDAVSLTNRRATDSPDLGMIVLHRISGDGSGLRVSASSLAAPRAALNSFEQGMKSSTTRQSAGTWSRKASSSAVPTTVPVGLFGLQTKISLVRGVIAAAIAARSWVWSAERDPDRVRGGQVAQDRVRLERAPRVHHLGAGLTDRLEELLGHSDRTAPDRDVLRRDAELVRDGPDQGLRAVVRVPVDRSRRLGDGIHHRGQRRERSFVG